MKLSGTLTTNINSTFDRNPMNFNPLEFSPSPIKAPSQPANKYRIDYSSMNTQVVTNNGSLTEGVSEKAMNTDKENVYDLETGPTVADD